jgi:hypothetical protein
MSFNGNIINLNTGKRFNPLTLPSPLGGEGWGEREVGTKSKYERGSSPSSEEDQ